MPQLPMRGNPQPASALPSRQRGTDCYGGWMLCPPPISLPLVLCACAIAAPAFAQSPAGENLVESETITVIALPLPPAVGAYGATVLDRSAVSDTASGRIEEALARVPGFQQFRRSDSRSANVSAQGITLRAIGGNAASRTLLLLDGVPQADAFFGFIPFSLLPADSIASARVTRGSGIGPFGAGAVAGVIELASTAPGSRESLALSGAWGSESARQLGVAMALPLGSGHVAIDINHEAGNGFLTTPVVQRVAATVPARYRGSSLALSAAIPVDAQTELYPRIAAFRDDRTLRFAGADNGADGMDASLRLLSRGRWQVEALTWLQARDFSSIVVSATSFRPTLNQRATPTTGWGGKLELRPPVGAGRLLRFGADVRGADGYAAEDALAPSGARTLSRRAGGQSLLAGAFAEGDLLLGALALTGGARIDHWRLSDGYAQEVRPDGSFQTDSRFAARSGSIPSVRAAAAWTVAHGLRLRASAYTGFRLPTLNELYRGFTVFPVATRANAALTPERLRGWEGGIEWTPADAMRFSLTGFDNRLGDAIANVTIGTNLRQRRNVAAIRARGVEATFHFEQNSLSFDAGWAWSRSRVRIDPADSAALPLDGLRPAQSPAHSGSLSIAWSSGGWRIQAGVRHVGAQFEDDRNIDVLPAATTVDALVRMPLARGLTLSLRGENLFDETVVTRNAAGSIDLGTPRTLWLALRWALD